MIIKGFVLSASYSDCVCRSKKVDNSVSVSVFAMSGYNLDQAFKLDNLFESPVPIVLSSSHASAAQKSTCLVQDGDRYIFLVEDNKSSKASSLCQGSGARNAKPSDEVSENPEQNEEGEDTGELEWFVFGFFFSDALFTLKNNQRGLSPHNNSTFPSKRFMIGTEYSNQWTLFEIRSKLK